MPDITLTAVPWAPATSVGAYRRTTNTTPTGAPSGSASSTAVVAANFSLTFTNLAEGDYWAAAVLDGGDWEYIAFRADSSGLTPYRTVIERVGQMNAMSNGTRAMIEGTVLPVALTTNVATGIFYFDPADYAEEGKATKLRLKASCNVNATAPVSDFTLNMRAVSAPAGAATIISVTGGTVVPNSSVVFTAPGAGAQLVATSGDFDPPAAGFYIVQVINSAVGAASSSVALSVRLEARNV